MTFSAITANLASAFRRSNQDEMGRGTTEEEVVSATGGSSGEPLTGISPQSANTECVRTGSDGADCADSAEVKTSGAQRSATIAEGQGLSSLADSAQGMAQAAHKLRQAIEELPEGRRKNEIQDQAIRAIELALTAEKAGEEVQRVEEAIAARPHVVPEKTLAALREKLNASLGTISTALDALGELDAAVEQHCADVPANGDVLRFAIAAVAMVLLALGLMLLCPPAAAVLAGGFFAIAGPPTVERLLCEYRERVDRRTPSLAANQEARAHLNAIAKKACALRAWEPASIQPLGTAAIPPTALPEPAPYLDSVSPTVSRSVPEAYVKS